MKGYYRVETRKAVLPPRPDEEWARLLETSNRDLAVLEADRANDAGYFARIRYIDT